MHWSNFCIFVGSIDSQIILRMIRESKMKVCSTMPITVKNLGNSNSFSSNSSLSRTNTSCPFTYLAIEISLNNKKLEAPLYLIYLGLGIIKVAWCNVLSDGDCQEIRNTIDLQISAFRTCVRKILETK